MGAEAAGRMESSSQARSLVDTESPPWKSSSVVAMLKTRFESGHIKVLTNLKVLGVAVL